MGGKGPARGGDMAIHTAWLVRKGVHAVVVGDLRGQGFPETERGIDPCAAGIFPLRFAGQAIVSTALFGESPV